MVFWNLWLQNCKTHCSGCVSFAWDLWGSPSDPAVSSFLNFCAGDFPLKSASRSSFFWPWCLEVLELPHLPLCAIPGCFATQSLQIALHRLHQGCAGDSSADFFKISAPALQFVFSMTPWSGFGAAIFAVVIYNKLSLSQVFCEKVWCVCKSFLCVKICCL